MYISNKGKDGMGLRPVCNVILGSRTVIVRQVSGIGITVYQKTHRGYEKTSVLETQTFNYNSNPPVQPPLLVIIKTMHVSTSAECIRVISCYVFGRFQCFSLWSNSNSDTSFINMTQLECSIAKLCISKLK